MALSDWVKAARRDRLEFETVAELERLARRKLPSAMFERLNGGADEGRTARANVSAFRAVWFRPRGASAAPKRSTSRTVLGCEISGPFLLAPVGALRLQHPDGVLAAVDAATRAGTICAISPGNGHALTDIELGEGAVAWYQVTTALGGRAAAERDIDVLKQRGYHAVVVTIDSVLRARSKPIRANLRSAARFAPDLARHPRWTYAFLRDGMRINVANAAMGAGAAPPEARPVTWDDFAWIKERWGGPLVIKGVMSGDDARRARDVGADAVVVSNHGGLTLDETLPTLRALPDVLDAVGDQTEVLLDGGIRSGADAVKALALGARAVLIGRPYVMGLAVDGARGVLRVLELMRDDADRTLAFLGCTTLDEVNQSHVYVDARQEMQ
jgi:isopentenyl diphosphate isomerase/L-lactate dehydrogenase-like FMN-dependent dehydrogenase